MRRYEILVYLHYAQSSSILKFPKKVHLVLWGSHTDAEWILNDIVFRLC